jgi:hypothetical protein
VKALGSDDRDGSNWQQAVGTVQAGLDRAAAKATATTPCEVWVAQGTYYPTLDASGVTPTNKPRTKTIKLRENVLLYGGFTGVETVRTERDYLAHQTILSGDLDVTGNLVDADNAYHVVTGTNGASIDGFTITLGNANTNDNSPSSNGGGMYNEGVSPTITNCTFTNNYGDTGGGMYNINSASPSIANCTFSANRANYGCAGLCILNRSSPKVKNCAFRKNDTTQNGGGVSIGNFSNPVIIGCAFEQNSAIHGAGLEIFGNSEPILRSCTFSGNVAAYRGGALNNIGASNSTIVNCTFSQNAADNGGAGIYLEDSSPIITNCVLWDNHAGSAKTVSSITVGSELLAPINAVVTYSDVEGGCTIADGCTTDATGNIDKNPQFDSSSTDGLLLGATSPCINAGNTEAAPTFDKLGNSRVGVADMGAYEYH